MKRKSTVPSVVAALLSGAALALAGGVSPATATTQTIRAVGAENEYANVIAQIGGRYASVNAIESNPNTDPHSFEASPSVAKLVSTAQVIVQNGVGYDTFMNTIEAGSPNSSRKVIDVQQLLGLPDSTPNPHLWYKQATMPAVAKALVSDLSAIEPQHRAYFQANATKFDASLQPWYAAVKAFAARYPHTPVATTEPVIDYMLQAAGTNILTPFPLEADIMNGVDPAPQAISLQESLFSKHLVKVLLYNQQVTDSLTSSFLTEARRDRIPVIGVYETMPTGGYDYQSWMLAEISALQKAVADKISTQKL